MVFTVLLKENLFMLNKWRKNQPDIPKMKNGLFQIIRMEYSVRLKRVKYSYSMGNVENILCQKDVSWFPVIVHVGN